MKNKKSSAEWPSVLREFGPQPVDSKVPTDVIQGLYVMRLVDEGVPVEQAFDLIVDGILRPN
jgi:hypothetical protein